MNFEFITVPKSSDENLTSENWVHDARVNLLDKTNTEIRGKHTPLLSNTDILISDVSVRVSNFSSLRGKIMGQARGGAAAEQWDWAAGPRGGRWVAAGGKKKKEVRS